MYNRQIVSNEFKVPETLLTKEFVLKPLTVHHLIKDFDAVMSSVEHLKGLMDKNDTWPIGLTIEENLIDPRRTVQVGIRGTNYDSEDRDFGFTEGIRIITIEEFFDRGVSDVMSEVKSILGNKETYLSYDIDFIDPAFAPGTGTPEVGGPNSFQALDVIRKLSGINLIGADLVEISPPFDQSGGTAFLGSSILFEILCILASK